MYVTCFLAQPLRKSRRQLRHPKPERDGDRLWEHMGRDRRLAFLGHLHACTRLVCGKLAGFLLSVAGLLFSTWGQPSASLHLIQVQLSLAKSINVHSEERPPLRVHTAWFGWSLAPNGAGRIHRMARRWWRISPADCHPVAMTSIVGYMISPSGSAGQNSDALCPSSTTCWDLHRVC